MNKDNWLDAAEVFDSWRVVPRIFMTACFFWVVYVTNILLGWYMGLPEHARGYEASGFASIVFIAIMGFLKLVFDTYSRHGRDWDAEPSMTATATVTTKGPS